MHLSYLVISCIQGNCRRRGAEGKCRYCFRGTGEGCRFGQAESGSRLCQRDQSCLTVRLCTLFQDQSRTLRPIPSCLHRDLQSAESWSLISSCSKSAESALVFWDPSWQSSFSKCRIFLSNSRYPHPCDNLRKWIWRYHRTNMPMPSFCFDVAWSQLHEHCAICRDLRRSTRKCLVKPCHRRRSHRKYKSSLCGKRLGKMFSLKAWALSLSTFCFDTANLSLLYRWPRAWTSCRSRLCKQLSSRGWSCFDTSHAYATKN